MAVAAYLNVPIHATKWKIGSICLGRRVAKLLFDKLKLARQLGPKHLFMEAIERMQEDELIRRLQFIEALLVFAFGIQGSNFSELAGKGKSVCRAGLHAYASYV